MEFSLDSFAHGRVHGMPEIVPCEAVRHKKKVVRNEILPSGMQQTHTAALLSRDAGKEAASLSRVK